MHMADPLLSASVGGAMYVCSGLAACYSVNKLRKREENLKVPVMGVMGALVFATQMINFTIPGTGSSGHLCGGFLMAALLGPEASFLTMIGVLLLQCLLFADGGILALGANIWNMAFYGCFIGGAIIWRLIMKNGINKKKITIASILGCILTLQLGAFSVVLETLASGVTELPFALFVGLMQPIHLAIGLGEGLITTAVLCFVYETRPELLVGYDKENAKKSKVSYKTFIVIIAALSLVVAGVVSLFASTHPDGLEWSIERVTGDTELATPSGIHETLEGVQESIAILPDYSLPNSESAAGTSLSGVVGALLVIVFCVLVGLSIKTLKQARGKKINQNYE